MNVVLWVVQILLAVVFLMTGVIKLARSREQLAARMPWVNDFPPAVIKGIGLLEVLGGIGVILPTVTGIFTWLAPLAAAGLILTMIGASLTNIRRHQYSHVVGNGVLLALAAVVAYGRLVGVPL